MRGGLAAALICMALVACADSSPDYADVQLPREVLHISNNVTTDTEDFTVQGRWQVRADIEGGEGISLGIVDAETGELLDVQSLYAGRSVSMRRGGCRCYLTVSTAGSAFVLRVTDLRG